MKSSTLSSNGQNDTLKGSSCFSSRLYPLFILTLLLLGSTAMQAQADCVHIPENFVTSDPSCPDQPDNIAKLDRSISDEILYVKVSGDACCGEFLVNPKSGPDCYSDTIAGPSGPEVEFLEVGTVSDLCDLEGLDTCAEGNTELLLGCGNGMIGHRITFLGRIEDGTDSYWYYHVENNVDGCTSDISHFTFGIVDESVCCIDYDIDTSAVCENENSVFTVTPTGADNYLFFLDTNMNNVLDAGDEELQNSASNVYTDTDSSLNHGDAIGVVVTSADAQCSDTNIINAIIYDLPVVDAGDAEVCTGNSVQLSATPTGGTWSGDHISSSGLFNATGLTAGDYVVTYTYTDTNECTNSDTATVTVNPLPVVEADDASVCTGSSVQLTASPEGGTWSGDHVSSTGLFNATGLTAGDYSVTYTYTDTNECTNSDTATVTVNPLPVVEADNAEVCIGSSVQLTASPEGGTWSGDHVSSTGLFNATGLTAGDYSVTYTYTDDNECTNSDTATVTVDPLPVVEADNASVCIGSSIQLTASPEGGTWSGAHVNSSGLFNATGLTAGPYMVTYTYTDDNECTNSDTATVTVDPLPVVEADNASVCIGSSVQLSASPEGGTWSGDHVNSSGVFNAAGLTAGPYVVTYTYTDDNECTNSDTATVTVDPLPVVEADNASVCIGSSIQLTASPEGGTWSGAHVNSSGLFNATGLTAGPYMVTYTYTDDNECTNSDTATVTVDPLPIVEADNASVCIGSSIQLSASPEGGTWSGAHVNSSGVFNAEGLTAGPYVVTYTYTDDNECTNSDTATVTVDPLPVVEADNASVCIGSSIQLTASPEGGTWSGAHVNSSGLFNATGLTAGPYMVTYTYTDDNECTNSDTATVTVDPLPIVEADNASVCIGSSIQLTASPEGGTWSGDHVNSSGVFNAAGLTAGPYVVTYTYTDDNECTNSDTATVTVDPVPVVEADDASVCIGSSIQLTASPEGGTWSGAHVNSSGLFNATGLTAGNYVVTYTYTSGDDCVGSDTATVTVNPLPVVEADNASVCIGSSVQLSASPEGGTWSGDHVNSSGVFNAAGLTAGPYVVTYTYTDDNECTNSDTATVTVDPLPVVEADNASVCIGSSIQLTASPEGGTWSGAHVNSSGLFNATGLTAGPYMVTYTYTDDNECTNSDTATVTVDPLPIVEADNASVCIGSSIQLTASPEGGTWSGDHVNSSGVFNAAGLTAGPYVVTYTYTDDNECTNSDTATVTVDPVPVVEADDASVCIGSSIQLSASPEGGTWSGNHVSSTGLFNATGLTAGNYVVTYTYTSGDDCVGSDTATVTVNPLPVVEADNASVCIGSSVQLSASPEGGTWSGAHINSSGLFNATGLTAGDYMVTYTYTDTNNCTNSDTATVTVDPLPEVAADNAEVCTGSSIQLNASPEGGTWSGAHINSSGLFNATGLTAGPYVVTYTYTDTNNCTNSNTATVTVNPLPEVEAEDASLCIGSSVQLSASPEGGTWSGDHVSSSGLFNAEGLTAGDYMVTYTYTDINNCTNSDTATVTVDPVPVVEADDASVCIGSSIQLSASPEGGTWSGNHVSSTGLFNATGLTAGNYVVTYTYTSGDDCVGSDTATVTVNPLPVVEADNASVCIGSSVQLGASPEGGTWSGDHVSSTGLFNATGLTAGDYMVTYTYTDTNNCTNSDTATVTVDPLPVVEADNASVCIGSSVQLSASPEGGTWSGAHINSSGLFNATGLTAGDYIVTYTYTDTNNCTNSDTATVTVNPLPEVEAEDASLCIGSSVQLSASPEGGTWSGDHVSSSGLFNAEGLTAGDYMVTYTYTDINNCTNSDTATVTVDPVPVVEADDASLCIGSSIQLSASPEGGTWSGNHVSSTGLFNATGLTAGNYVVTYTYTSGDDCVNSDEAIVTVNDGPVLDIFLPPLDCFAEGGAIQVISDTEGLEFSLDGGPWFEYTGPVEDIAPGDHSLVARDAETLCQSIAEDFTIGPLLDSPITPVLDAIQPTCEEMTGTIRVTSRTEGLQFFVILTSELPFVDPLFVDYPSGGFTNLAPGAYSVFAQSADNCVSGIATIVLNEPTDCFEGCTLGYWKNHTDRWCDTYQTCTLYGDVFEGAPDELAGLTLLEVLNQGGGGIYNLGRQSVAALLNACIGDITYALATPDDVIDYVTANFGNAGTAGEYLDMLNNAGCELGGSKATSASTCDDVVDGGNGNNGNGNNGNNGNNGRDNSGNEDSKVASNVVAFPVPFKESLNLKYNLDYISDVIIEVFDMKGRHLRTYKDKNAGQGSESQLNVDFRLKANQVYVIKITTDRESFVQQVISSKK